MTNTCSIQGAQLEPQLGSTKFALVVLELLVLSQAIMVRSFNAFVSGTAACAHHASPYLKVSAAVSG